MAQGAADSGISRRDFMGQGAAGFAAVALSPMLLELLREQAAGGKPGAPAASDRMLAEDVLRQAVALLMAKGASFADVYVERSAKAVVSSDDRKINTRTTIEKGVGLRAVKGGKTFYAFTTSFEPKQIFATARTVADAAAKAAGATGAVAVLKEQRSELRFAITPQPSDSEVAKTIELAKALSERAWSADPRVVQVGQALRESVRQIELATSSGRLVRQTLGLTEFYSSTHMKDQTGNLQSGFDGRGAYAGRSFFTGPNAFEQVVDKSVARTRLLLEAVDSPRGVFPVVLGPGDNGVIFHESCGHGMEADLVFKGSNFKDQIGKQTAAKGVTLIDDGTLANMPGSFAFDDEGTPSERTVLVEDGVQKNYLCDLTWAERLGLKSTGSGRRESFRVPPIPRMRNTFIAAGPLKPADIIAATKRGIYVAMVGGGGQVDVITGNFMMGVGEAYLIEHGKVTKPIKGATLSGMGVDALKSIDLVGNDLEVFPSGGRCGKGQAAPVGCGMPTTRVRGMLVGGNGPAWDEPAGGAR